MKKNEEQVTARLDRLQIDVLIDTSYVNILSLPTSHLNGVPLSEQQALAFALSLNGACNECMFEIQCAAPSTCKARVKEAGRQARKPLKPKPVYTLAFVKTVKNPT